MAISMTSASEIDAAGTRPPLSPSLAASPLCPNCVSTANGPSALLESFARSGLQFQRSYTGIGLSAHSSSDVGARRKTDSDETHADADADATNKTTSSVSTSYFYTYPRRSC